MSCRNHASAFAFGRAVTASRPNPQILHWIAVIFLVPLVTLASHGGPVNVQQDDGEETASGSAVVGTADNGKASSWAGSNVPPAATSLYEGRGLAVSVFSFLWFLFPIYFFEIYFARKAFNRWKRVAPRNQPARREPWDFGEKLKHQGGRIDRFAKCGQFRFWYVGATFVAAKKT